MNDTETIQAAINMLEALKAESTPGDWDIQDNGDRFIAWHDDPASTGFEYIIPEPVEFERDADADLIVTLHRTIDAQLAILHVARVERPANQKLGLDLARAILGEVS